MNEDAARTVMARLGIPVTHRSQKGWLNARCPLATWTHKKGEDRRPAFAIQINEDGPSHYKCLGCHWKGRVSQLVRSLERFQNTSFGSLAVDCDMYDVMGVFGSGFERPPTTAYDEPMAVDESMVEGLYPPAQDVPQAMAYLRNRGVGLRAIEALEIAWDPDERRVMFPCRGRGRELYGFTGRTVLEERFYPYREYYKVRDYLGLPKAGILLGMHLVRKNLPSFVVEGIIGLARIIEEGALEVCNPLALLGSEMTPQKANLLASLDQGAYLMTDPDEAGEACLWGRWDAVAQDHNGQGAVKELMDRGLPVFVPEWPVEDVDLLTLDHIKDILDRCPLYGWG